MDRGGAQSSSWNPLKNDYPFNCLLHHPICLYFWWDEYIRVSTYTAVSVLSVNTFLCFEIHWFGADDGTSENLIQDDIIFYLFQFLW